jgi:hypothetical protein
MDMMIPHSESYFEGMAPEDSAKYVTYLKDNRNKHSAWEKDNIKAFVDAGQWTNEIYRSGAGVFGNFPYEPKSGKNVPDEFRVIPLAGRWAVQCSERGMISILDMKGRTLRHVNVNGVMKNGLHLVTIPATMPTGMYIARFCGKGVVRQRVVAFLTNR